MLTAIIIGSGPAAAGVALALTEHPDQEVVVLDLGKSLEGHRASGRARLAERSPSEWHDRDVAELAGRARTVKGEPLPQKRTFGSTFPFDNMGQLDGIDASAGANGSVVSGAYGGFSNVWGAQIMPFSEPTFDDWPCSFNHMEPHYRRVLEEVPLAAEADDLEAMFPLIHATSPPPSPSERTTDVVSRGKRNRARLQRHGVTVGSARLALRARDCVRCGLCMTGCPYELIYSSSHTFDRLRRTKRVSYHDGLLVIGVAQQGDTCHVRAREVRTGQVVEFHADRVYLACGAIGTTRLVLASMAAPPRRVELLESIQFGLPFLSRHPTADPRTQDNHTLNQFNLVVDVTGFGKDLVQVHCYPYNPAFSDSLPPPLRSRPLEPVHRRIRQRVTVGLGYLPSWASPKVILDHEPGGDGLPSIRVSGQDANNLPMLRQALRALRRVGPVIDLWPVPSQSFVSGPAKSYHFGGSFPHAIRRGPLVTDQLGRLPEWDRIHLTDASVFPTVPATTFTLTVMANAHRIAQGSLCAG